MRRDRRLPRQGEGERALAARPADEARGREGAGGGLLTPRKQSAPSAARNREPIIAVLRQHLPSTGHALEIASGTGEHCVAFARAFPGIQWHPSDAAPDALESISAWREEAALANIAPPIRLDVTEVGWTGLLTTPPDAVLAINLVHIAPWAATQGLVDGAGGVLASGGLLYLYGAYKRGGAHTAPSNVEFDAWLKRRDPEWGVRDLEAVEQLAAEQGLVLEAVVEMPANNLSLIFRKRGEG